MKKLICLMLAAIIVCALVGCVKPINGQNEEDKGLHAATNNREANLNIDYSTDKSTIKVGEDLTLTLRVYLLANYTTLSSCVSSTLRVVAIDNIGQVYEEDKEITLKEFKNFDGEWQEEVVVSRSWFSEKEGIILFVAYANYVFTNAPYELEETNSIHLCYIIEDDTIKLFDSEYEFNQYKNSLNDL